MGKIQDLMHKKYLKLKAKYPEAEKVYSAYKSNNLEFHRQHRLTSYSFYAKLIRATKQNKDVKKVSFPTGTYNPFFVKNSLSKKPVKLSENDCLAVPDSKLCNRMSPEDFAKELAQYEVISFDVFDTCIFRPFENPVDLFYLLEAKNGVINFNTLRIDAEASARQKTGKPNFEVDIYDIYEEISHRCRLKKEDAEKEISLEKEVCYANPYMLKVFKILKKKNKKLIAISDMYLPSKVINDML